MFSFSIKKITKRCCFPFIKFFLPNEDEFLFKVLFELKLHFVLSGKNETLYLHCLRLIAQ